MRGALYMTLGSFAAVVNDGLVRIAIDDGVGIYQALFLRGCGMVAILALALGMRGERYDRQSLTRPLTIRVAAEVVVAGTFFAALVHLDFANAYVILMMAPFAVVVVAGRLGEYVTRRDYVLAAIGFAGVVAVMRPTSEAFSPWAFLVVASAGALVVREFATQRVDAQVPPLVIALLTAFALTITTGAVSASSGWSAVTARAAGSLALACGFLVVGYLFVIETVRVGDLSVSAPFRYTTVVGAVVVGFVFFGETPDSFTILGCTLIVVAGTLMARTASEIGSRPGAAPLVLSDSEASGSDDVPTTSAADD